jgi:hypothetical protein
VNDQWVVLRIMCGERGRKYLHRTLCKWQKHVSITQSQLPQCVMLHTRLYCKETLMHLQCCSWWATRQFSIIDEWESLVLAMQHNGANTSLAS